MMVQTAAIGGQGIMMGDGITAFTRWLNSLFKRVDTELKVGPL
jgi:hypothetical protein